MSCRSPHRWGARPTWFPFSPHPGPLPGKMDLVTQDPSETVIVDVSSWLLGSFRRLTRQLAKAPAILAPPGAGDDREGVSVAVRVPTYWAEAADALTEVLQIAAQTDSDLRFNVRVIPAEERLTLSVEEAAALLGISRAFAYEAVRRGEIPFIRIGLRILVPHAALNRLLSATAPPSTGE